MGGRSMYVVRINSLELKNSKTGVLKREQVQVSWQMWINKASKRRTGLKPFDIWRSVRPLDVSDPPSKTDTYVVQAEDYKQVERIRLNTLLWNDTQRCRYTSQIMKYNLHKVVYICIIMFLFKLNK